MPQRDVGMKRPDKNLIVGLDIGTSKVSAIVGEVVGGDGIEVDRDGHPPLARIEEREWW